MIETYDELVDRVGSENPDATVFPDLKEACIGATESPEGTLVLVYDEEKIINHLMRDSDMDREGAIEWLEFNTKGTKRGVANDPIFITPCSNT